ncbi:MAG: c-type cytochrome, partial [Deltaproteobacteria bacterium]|nr:c-type cytochrome [Kofleriaceae bacterium]
FKTQCAVCHGESGKGDGVGAASLEPKPRNYTDKEWQASTDDARIKKVILEGGAANGLNAAMPPYASQIDGAVADELVKLIRAFGA